ncbi:ATP-binding cassette domain-containing protein [Paracoccus suum]|uniref:ATP-binding cassette domain-containing protein n=1 Tax=Paracoccus suum TaxID=2259340 RepID=A0A344PLQ6_9RHOB|nr:ATP-binding cassette domain-containing protein [Paracoccus suum]AXC50311.1 ATP-binding cassette domain-containing protein [Paracoccus suum]
MTQDVALRPPALLVEGVSHAFGLTRALDGVSLQVMAGQFVALLGINGAGKSTLINVATRLYDSGAGRVAIAGHDLRRAPSAALARLGVVFQSRALDADLTVAQNLHYHAALHGIGRAEARGRIAEVLALVDLQDKARARVATLSGGQVRRAEIARALIHRPEVMILDEPTTGLDVRSRAEVLALTQRLTRTGAVGVLWATHLLAEVTEADAIIVLHQGRVLWSGPPQDLAREGDLTAAFLSLTGAQAAA